MTSHDESLLRVTYSSQGAWYTGLWSGREWEFEIGDVRSQQIAKDLATYCERQVYLAEMDARADAVVIEIDYEYRPQRLCIGELCHD